MVAIPAKVSVSLVDVPVSVAAKAELPANLGIAYQMVEGQPYAGSYDITPTTSQQTLPTANKVMSQNLIVRAVPYTETDNAAGGKTLSIG